MSNGGRTKICFVTLEFPPDWGGVSKSAKRIVGMLAAAGFDVHVFALDRQRTGSDAFDEVEQAAGSPVTVHRVKIEEQSYAPSALEAIARDLTTAIDAVDRQVHFDLFHGFFLPLAFPCLKLPSRGRRPLIASIRGDDAAGMLRPESPFRAALEEVIKGASWITSVTSDGLARAQKVADISRRSSLIPNSISPLQAEPWTLRPVTAGVVGTVCTIREKKNIPGLVRAYAAVAPAVRSRLLVVGDFFEGDEINRAAVAQALEAGGVASEVTITGYINNAKLPDYLHRMRVFVMSSLHEGFPNTILEAASLGLPIVSTAVDGVKDFFYHSDAVLLVQPGDDKAMTEALEAVLRDDALAQGLSRASRNLAAQFSYEREQSAWVHLYRQMLAMEPGREAVPA